MTTIIGERFGKKPLIWWSEDCVYQAQMQLDKINKVPIDEIKKKLDELKYRGKTNKRRC